MHYRTTASRLLVPIIALGFTGCFFVKVEPVDKEENASKDGKEKPILKALSGAGDPRLAFLVYPGSKRFDDGPYLGYMEDWSSDDGFEVVTKYYLELLKLRKIALKKGESWFSTELDTKQEVTVLVLRRNGGWTHIRLLCELTPK